MGHITLSPQTYSVTVAVECVSDLLIGWLVRFGGTEHNPTAVDHRLGRRTGANQSVERLALFG
jgi:hypothetical protein